MRRFSLCINKLSFYLHLAGACTTHTRKRKIFSLSTVGHSKKNHFLNPLGASQNQVFFLCVSRARRSLKFPVSSTPYAGSMSPFATLLHPVVSILLEVVTMQLLHRTSYKRTATGEARFFSSQTNQPLRGSHKVRQSRSVTRVIYSISPG
jgi:hypothetical protein